VLAWVAVGSVGSWIDEIDNPQISGGCSAASLEDCPTSRNNRGRMAAFLVKTFGFVLYGG
jgi:hypothetical protein